MSRSASKGPAQVGMRSEEAGDDGLLKTMQTMESARRLKCSPETLCLEQIQRSRVQHSGTVKKFASIESLPAANAKKSSLKRRRTKKQIPKESPGRNAVGAVRSSGTKG